MDPYIWHAWNIGFFVECYDEEFIFYNDNTKGKQYTSQIGILEYLDIPDDHHVSGKMKYIKRIGSEIK